MLKRSGWHLIHMHEVTGSDVPDFNILRVCVCARACDHLSPSNKCWDNTVIVILHFCVRCHAVHQSSLKEPINKATPLLDLRFSQWWPLRGIFWMLYRVVWWKSADVSEEQIASIFRVEDEAKQTSMKQSLLPASCWFLASTLKMEAICPSKTSVGFHQTTPCYTYLRRLGSLFSIHCYIIHRNMYTYCKCCVS
jgi:hypothetical protein